MTFETRVRSKVLQVAQPGARWLATGWSGGYWRRDAVYNVTVPSGFDRTDLEPYVNERLADAGFDREGIPLLTGAEQANARGARLGPVEVVATAGLSNPATLPLEPRDEPGTEGAGSEKDPPVGTINVVAGTTRSLDDGALATLVSTVAEAKAATLVQSLGFTGTTSDAVVVGCDPDGDPATFAGSASTVGAAARACVREALQATLAAHYSDADPPESVADAPYGVVTDERARVFEVSDSSHD
ncbi:adenosylcobinamide amidohydrolase [Haloarculaceae archaeon H-GB11]|nr:adenosylcobinamide amidohydrolase [Haloarculaceae archaeon H-GB11]